MRQIKRLLTFALLFASVGAWAETEEGVIVKTGDAEQQFAISEIKEITFSDDGMTVVKTDEAIVSFDGDWQISFGEVETTGISLVDISKANAPAEVYDANGVLVKEVGKISQLQISELPKGVYIIMCNGKSIKIKR